MSSFASSNKNDNNKPSTPRQKKNNVFTRLVPQTIRMLEHMPQFSNNSSSQSEEAERKALENKSKLITAYIRDDWIQSCCDEKYLLEIFASGETYNCGGIKEEKRTVFEKYYLIQFI